MSSASSTVIPLLIDGKEEVGPRTFDVVSPCTGEICWSATAATEKDAVRAANAAAAALPAWSKTKPATRRDIILKAADNLESRLRENSEIMRTEMGADVTSQALIIPMAIRLLRDVAGRIGSICGSVPSIEQDGRSAIVFKEPIGVVLGIVPWNAPHIFGARSIAYAIAGGNTTVLKASEFTPRCYWVVGRAFQDAGLPAGCLNIVSCRANDTAQDVRTLIEHPAVRKINFTGSTAVGRQVAQTCGMNLKPCLMELGGKNSAIVCADADLDLAAKSILTGSFLNSGQVCVSTDRILLHADIADEFAQVLRKAAESPSDTDSTHEKPILVSAASKARVQRVLSDALSSGARVIVGSELDDDKDAGVRVNRVILDSVRQDMDVWKNEVFAPLAACMTVESDEQAVAVANEGGYGLSAAIFTEDLRKGLAMAKKIETGAVHINSMTVHDEAALPFGGVKNSGWGRFNSDMGLNEFLVTKTVTWKD